jgi:hypothetical protein
MQLSKLQVQLIGYAVALLSVAYAFWESSKVILDTGGLMAAVAAWSMGPISMTIAGLHAAITTGNWWLLVSIFLGVPLGLVLIVAGNSMSGSGL